MKKNTTGSGPRKGGRAWKRKRRDLLKQKMVGVLMLLITAYIFYAAYTGRTTGDTDCTAALISLPAGIGCLIAKEVYLDF